MKKFRKKTRILQKFKGYFHRDNPLLKAVILIAAIGIAASSPYGAAKIPSIIAKLIGEKLKDHSWTDNDVRNSLYRLHRSKFIKYKVSGNTVKLELTKKGKRRFNLYKFDEMAILKPPKWDRAWRLVVFDIPEKRKVGRDVLRDKLKKLGFFRIQKSVWVCPYPCGEEIHFICEFFGVGRYVLYFETKLDDDYYLRKHYHLGT